MGATKIVFGSNGVIDTPTYADLYDKSFDVYHRREQSIPLQGEELYYRETATNLQHKLTTYSNILNVPRLSQDADVLSFQVPMPGYSWTIPVLTFRDAIAITRTMQKIDRSGMVGIQQGGLLDAMRRLLEKMFAYPINNGLTTAGADGSYLFATDHYQIDPAAGTWSNIDTSAALTSYSVSDMKASMAQRTNEKGDLSPIELARVIVPQNLADKMGQISNSTLVPENALHATNPMEKMKYKVWQYLTSTTAFYGQGKCQKQEFGLHYVVLTDPEVSRLNTPSFGYPDIVAGWRSYAQVATSGSVLFYMHRNAGV